jgi:tetratricopeptide (TPR) repeat protein
MTAARRLTSNVPPPAECLQQAMKSSTAESREAHARAGLGTKGRLEGDTQALLLRQLGIALYEQERFEEAFSVSEQASQTAKKRINLEPMLDVFFEDLARAALAMSRVDGSLSPRVEVALREAIRVSPTERKGFHWWSLGNFYFFAARYTEAKSCFRRAARRPGSNQALFRGQYVLTQIASGELVTDVTEPMKALAAAPSSRGYGAFVMGHLAYAAGAFAVATRYLSKFVAQNNTKLRQLSLRDELEMAEATLAKMRS